jgi:chromosome segregation ATPase
VIDTWLECCGLGTIQRLLSQIDTAGPATPPPELPANVIKTLIEFARQSAENREKEIRTQLTDDAQTIADLAKEGEILQQETTRLEAENEKLRLEKAQLDGQILELKSSIEQAYIEAASARETAEKHRVTLLTMEALKQAHEENSAARLAEAQETFKQVKAQLESQIVELKKNIEQAHVEAANTRETAEKYRITLSTMEAVSQVREDNTAARLTEAQETIRELKRLLTGKEKTPAPTPRAKKSVKSQTLDL